MKVSEHDDKDVRPTAGLDEPAGPGRVTGRQLRELLADDLWLDELVRHEAPWIRVEVKDLHRRSSQRLG